FMSMQPSPLTTTTPRPGCASASPRPRAGAWLMADGRYAKSSGVSDRPGKMPAALMVVRTTCRPRWAARTSRASRAVIMVGSLPRWRGPGRARGPGLAVGGGQRGRARAGVQDYVRQAPGLQDRLGEHRAGVRAGALPVGVVAAHADEEEQRQVQVVDE